MPTSACAIFSTAPILSSSLATSYRQGNRALFSSRCAPRDDAWSNARDSRTSHTDSALVWDRSTPVAKKAIPQGSRDCWISCGTVRCSARWLDACRYPAGECLERAHDQRRREVAVAVVRHAPLQKHIRRASRRHDIGKGWLVKEWYEWIPEVVNAHD